MADPEFELLWNLPARALDAPNRRGDGTSTAAVVEAVAWPLAPTTGRVFLKRQQAFFCRPVWNAFRRTPTLRRERRFLERARAIGISVPTIVYYREGTNDRAILAVEEVADSVDFEQALAAADATSRVHVLERVGDALAALHTARIVHGALYPKHILVGVDALHRVTLIDFEKGRAAIGKQRGSRLDLDRLARHAPFLTQGDWIILRGRYAARR
jgi:predicted Ser/Thr protein kinase